MKSPRAGIRLRRAFRVLTPDGFALAPLWMQLAAIFATSATIILLWAPLLGSLSQSYRLFSDPSSFADAEDTRQLVFGFFQVGFGLILFSFIISVLSSALEQLIERIRGGTRPYTKRDHLLIINRNAKLPHMLDQINARYARLDRSVDVVLLLGSRAEVEDFREGLEPERWLFLNLFIRQGDLLSIETFRRVALEAATGVVVLAPGGTEVFAADNLNLKILTALTNDQAYWSHLLQRQKEKRPVKCAVELSSQIRSREIAHMLTAAGGHSLFSVTTPGDVIGRVLSRSITDIVHYKLYLEIFSFSGHAIYFVDPQALAGQGLAPGQSFEDLSRGFTQGLLIGFSHLDAGGIDLQLAPAGRVLGPDDWLIVIARDARAMNFAARPALPTAGAAAVIPPSEIRRRHLCLIGDERTFASLPDFLHAESRQLLADAHFVFPGVEQYFDPAFVARLHAGGFDNVVINLDDETGFRFTLYLLGQFPAGDPFLDKVVTVLTDSVTEGLLSRQGRFRNTILSDKLAAHYLTQLCFQKNLERLYDLLSAPEGAEFNLLEVGVHIPREFLTTKPAVKDLLLARGLVYVGTVDEHKEVCFDADDFAAARQLVVLSHGDR